MNRLSIRGIIRVTLKGIQLKDSCSPSIIIEPLAQGIRMWYEAHIWAVTCDSQQCGILTSIDSDEPVQPPFELGNSKWCSVSCLTVIEYLSDQQRHWSDCAYARADLRLCWSHIPQFLEISCRGSYYIFIHSACMRSYLVWLKFPIYCQSEPTSMSLREYLCRKGAVETACMCRLIGAFVPCICDQYQTLISS